MAEQLTFPLGLWYATAAVKHTWGHVAIYVLPAEAALGATALVRHRLSATGGITSKVHRAARCFVPDRRGAACRWREVTRAAAVEQHCSPYPLSLPVFATAHGLQPHRRFQAAWGTRATRTLPEAGGWQPPRRHRGRLFAEDRRGGRPMCWVASVCAGTEPWKPGDPDGLRCTINNLRGLFSLGD